MQQGSKANHSGQKFEKEVSLWLESNGHTVKPSPQYEALWGTGKERNRADIYLPESDTQLELKRQAVPGTCDQKAFAELWNAHERIKCSHYILILGGSHWDSTRGNNIYQGAKKMAAVLNGIPSTGAKKLSVFKYPEYQEWMNE